MIGIAVLLSTAGCAGERVRAADAAAQAAGLTAETIAGDRFVHRTYSVDAVPPEAGEPVWIYMEGDGVPWIDEVVPAADPTPRSLVALAMMAGGPRPAVYLGRPCYFGTATTPPCAPVWWTHRRFAPEVVASMRAALQRVLERHGWTGRPLVLVGFSGGGTLAALLAARMSGVCALVTVASPLDIDEWAGRHGYSPLEGSLNPALLAPYPAAVPQLHWRGGRDRVVAADDGARFRERNPRAAFRVVPEAAHGEEWVRIWTGQFAARTGAAALDCTRP